MQKVYQASDILGKYGLAGEEYTGIGWGAVELEDNLLCSQRYKEDDPCRRGEWLIPGGKRKHKERYPTTARREVWEETNVIATHLPISFVSVPSMMNNIIVKPRENIVAAIDIDGRYWFWYPDSGKRYTGYAYRMTHVAGKPTPVERVSRNPQYIPFDEVLSGNRTFTPACEIIFDAFFDGKGRHLIGKDDILVDPNVDLGSMMRIKPPERVRNRP